MNLWDGYDDLHTELQRGVIMKEILEGDFAHSLLVQNELLRTIALIGALIVLPILEATNKH